MLAELYKILGSTKIKTQFAVLKFQSAYHFTIPPIRNITKIGFSTTREEPNGILQFKIINNIYTLPCTDSVV